MSRVRCTWGGCTHGAKYRVWLLGPEDAPEVDVHVCRSHLVPGVESLVLPDDQVVCVAQL